ncbi:hypothetical protein TWF281_006164 [Arthrobotrys megalospora]
MTKASTSFKVQLQAAGKAEATPISTVTSKLQLCIQFLLWLLSPFQNHRQILIGLEKSCPDAPKHFLALPGYTSTLFSQGDKPFALSFHTKEDGRVFIRKAYQRYLHRKRSQTKLLDGALSIDDQGIIQELSEWRSAKQRGASPIYNALQSCNLTNLQTSTSLILVWQLCRDFGTFSFPWSASETDFSSWRQCVDYSFFGGEGNWNPLRFQKPMDNLTICQIRNRIAVLGESIGWTPDFHGEIEDSEEIVAFREEIRATCFFCCDQKPMWQMCVLHCEHVSCVKCIKLNYKMCLEDTSLLPPTCCKRYPLVYSSIAAGSINDIQKLARWIVTGANPSPLGKCYACSKYIWRGAERGDIGLCVSCDEKTCLKCGIKWHDFSRVECQLGQLSGFVSMVVANKWAQCYRCGLVVERRDGCAHIKCRCGADFCYHCGGKWPKCPCRTAGRKSRLNITRDQAVEDSGDRYTKTTIAKHHARAVASEQKYMEVVDALKLLRVMKTYQESVIREIGNLRKRLRMLREEEEDNIEYGSVSAALEEYMGAMVGKGNAEGLFV